MRRILALLAITLLALALAPIPLTSAQQVPVAKVVKFEVDRTTVYAKYQYIEVRAYLSGSPTLTIARATLYAGIVVTVNLSLVSLYEPIEVSVGNITYTVSRIAIGRVPVPAEAAFVGRALLVVEVEGSQGGSTFRNTTKYTITIVSSAPVDDERLSAYRALDKASTLALVASAMGADVANELRKISDAESVIKDAEVRLSAGEVDQAIALFREARSALDDVTSSLLSKILTISRETSSSIASLNTSLAGLSAYAKSLEKSLTDFAKGVTSSIETLQSNIQTLAKQQEDLSKRVDAVVSYINDLGSAISHYSEETNKRIESLASSVDALSKQQTSLASSVNTAIGSLTDAVNRLDSKVNSLADAQNRLSSLLNNLQLAVIVLAILLLIAIVLLGIRIRK